MHIYSFRDCLNIIAYRNKYDLASNQLTREIFDRVTSTKDGLIVTYENVVVNVKVDVVDKVSSFENFDLSATTAIDVTKSIQPVIDIHVALSKDFESKDYSHFYFALYEVIRHEIEHYHKYVIDSHPDKDYIQTYQELMNIKSPEKDLLRHIQLVSKYILSDAEIDSYARSIVYVAKKQKVTPSQVMDQIFKRAFFNNNTEWIKIATNDINIWNVVELTQKTLWDRIKTLYPNFKEKWL
jgi:hypothetical protein